MIRCPVIYIRYKGDILQRIEFHSQELLIGHELHHDINPPISIGNSQLKLSKIDSETVMASSTNGIDLLYKDEYLNTNEVILDEKQALTVDNQKLERFDIKCRVESVENISDKKQNPASLIAVNIATRSEDGQASPIYVVGKNTSRSSAIPQEKEPQLIQSTAVMPYGEPTVAREYCSLCLNTLDPNDADEKLRYFIIADNKSYHRYCWVEKLQRKEDETRVYHVQPPVPLKIVERVPVLTSTGPTNSIYDKPLGISEGTIVLKDKHTIQIYVRNNTNETLTISRNIGPGWVYMNMNPYHEVSNKLVIPPKMSCPIILYTHRVSPPWMKAELEFNERQYMLILSEYFTPIFVFMMFLLFSFSIIHILSVFNWIFGSLKAFLPVAFSIGLIGGWISFMMPAKALWTIYEMLDWLKSFLRISNTNVIARPIVGLQHIIWEQFSRQRIADIFNDLPMLFIISLACFVSVTIISMPIWFLISMLLGFFFDAFGIIGQLLIAIAYAVLYYYLFSLITEQYGFNPWQKAIDFLKQQFNK